MKWGEDQTCQFVKIYLKYELLWKADDKYKARNIKMKSYRDIISEFKEATGIELNIAELRLKIKNLKSTYTQELLKIKRRSKTNSTYRSSLKWFSLWHKRFANINNDEVNSSYHVPIEDISEVWMSQANDLKLNTNMEDTLEDNRHYDVIEEAESNNSYRHDNVIRIRNPKNRTRRPSVECSDRSLDRSMESLDSTQEDEFDVYGKYIASQLRKMDLQGALRVQLGIQSLLSEAMMSDCVNKH